MGINTVIKLQHSYQNSMIVESKTGFVEYLLWPLVFQLMFQNL